MNRRLAPSVSYPVGPCVLYGRLLLATWLLGAAIVGGHAWHAARAPAGAVLLLGLAAWWACRAWQAAPSGWLRWAGADGWAWQSGDAELMLGAPSVVWWGNHHLLLRWDTGPRHLGWLWIERRRHPGRWEALCRAAGGR